ncbi:hypothetical protein HRbin40_00853 [bacterium HR40]|nr:hypothetical protein HRbin40_00853 [bacterium HR40]
MTSSQACQDLLPVSARLRLAKAPRPRWAYPLRYAALVLVLAWLAACSRPMLPFDTETPPLVLAPARLAGIRDDRGRFREIVCDILAREGEDCETRLWRMAAEPPGVGAEPGAGPLARRYRLLLVTGFGAQCFFHLVRAFEDAEARLAAMGAQLVHVPVTAFGSVRQNAAIVRDAVLAEAASDDAALVLLGYSKGAADAIEALRRYPEVARRIVAFVSIAGAVNGSPLAEAVPDWLQQFVAFLPATRCDPGDWGALADLFPRRRLAALAEIPGSLPVPTFALVAFAEEERISTLLRPFWSRLAAADPRNDGQVLWHDQIPPGATLLGYLRGDHLAVAVPVAQKLPRLAHQRIDRNDFPRALVMEALMRYLDATLPATSGGSVSGNNGSGSPTTSTRQMSSPLSPTSPGRAHPGTSARS